jgi:hypothetical protein
MKTIKFVQVNNEWIGYDGLANDFRSAKCFQGSTGNIIKALVKKGYVESQIEIYSVVVNGTQLKRESKLDQLLN